MQLITPFIIDRMRRGAEKLYIKHQNSLPDACVVIKQDIAQELGLPNAGLKASPVPAAPKEMVGLFDDEPEATVIPTVMTKVKLVDYIEALKAYKVEKPTPAAVKEEKAK